MLSSKKIAVSFQKIIACKKCKNKLNENSSDESLRLGLCLGCHDEYLETKKYLDKYVKEFGIDKNFDKGVDSLISQYKKEGDFEKIFFSKHKDDIYQYLCEMVSPPLSPPYSELPEDGGGELISSDSSGEEESLLKMQLERAQMEKQRELFERSEQENKYKIADFLAKNKHFREYCKKHFATGITVQEKELAENAMILYLFELRDKGWPKYQVFRNIGNPLQLSSDKLAKKYCCYEYYAQAGRKEGLFRFVVLIDLEKNQLVQIYFTSTHYEQFIELNI